MNPPSIQSAARKKLPLRPGERLTQEEFHRRYEACPKDVKAELIGGIVHMPSPLRQPHGLYQIELSGALWLYKNATPGVELLDNTTAILGERSEPQPDLALRIRADHGGQSSVNEKEYVQGPPELLAEIAYSSADIDLNEKRDDYEQAGVVEYVVLCIAEQALHWFDFRQQRVITANRRGIARSRVFPGLWIDVKALLTLTTARLVSTIEQGLASREHKAFVKRLAAAHRKLSKGGT